MVFRARDKRTGEVFALKKVKMEKEREGFPLTALREVNILLSFHHPNIVNVSEMVVGSSLNSVFMVMEFADHDLKGLMEEMRVPFTIPEVGRCKLDPSFKATCFQPLNLRVHTELST